MKWLFMMLAFFTCLQKMKAQNVGIGTTEPVARLHVADSSVLFSGSVDLPYGLANPPISGQGTRLMWYSSKAALRAGYVQSNQWDKDNVGRFSFASGLSTVAKGSASLAVGENNSANGTSSAAFGRNTVAQGDFSISGGLMSTASGYTSLAIGYQAVANEDYSIALGYSASASGNYSNAQGYQSIASGLSSTAIGTGTIANSRYMVAVGSYNDVSPAVSARDWVGTDPIFQVGNGGGASNRSTALHIQKNGWIGINNITPQAWLHVTGNQIIDRNSYTGGAHLTLNETGTNDGARLQFRSSSITGKYWDLYGSTHASSNADAYFNIYYDGVGNNMMLRGNGNVWFRGTVSQSSDARLKKNIAPIDHALDKVLYLSGYHYEWIDQAQDNDMQSGVLAQEVEVIMPELVDTSEDGNKSVNYNGLIPYLIEAIKQQQKEIDELKMKINCGKKHKHRK
jgi:hypothetical protein